MVIDTSAIAAILLGEPEKEALARAIESAPIRTISAVSRVELAMVIETRKGEAGRADLERLLHDAGIAISEVTVQQVELAIGAFRRFGKGRHPAGLNIGDCFVYALARSLDLPLLFKGGDFSRTDLILAEPA